MKFAYCLLLIACALAYVTFATAYNKTAYCGVPAFPAALNSLPQLKKGLEQYKPQLTDYHVLVRHGDRSTGTLDCFSKTEYGNRNWTQCENPLTTWHTGLDERERRATQYDIPFASMTDKQALIGTCGIGQLTQKGVLQSYNQGKRIAAFLEKAYENRPRGTQKITEENFTLRSTDVHRTRETMTSLVAGVFDEIKHIKKNPKNMPVVGFVDAEYDALQVGQKALCIDAATAYLRTVYSNATYVQVRNDVMVPLNTAIKAAVNDAAQDVNTMFDCVHTYQCNGWEMPPAFQPLAQEVDNAQHWFWRHVFTHNRTLSAQVMNGPLLVDLAQKFIKSSLKTAYDEPTINIMTGHDIGPLLPLLLVFARDSDFYWPSYASLLSFEFYKTQYAINGETSFMRFMFNEDVYIPFVCDGKVVNGELCPTKVILQYLVDLFPTKEQCPMMPPFDYKTMRQEALQSAELLKASNSEPQLASAIVNIYDKLVENLHDDLADEVNPVFRTQSDENGDMTFEDMLEAFNGKLFG